MISYIMRSLLLILVCALVINSDARSLGEHRRQLGAFNRKPHHPPPPPNSEPPSGVDIPFLESSNNFVSHGATPPPPPKSATPVIEMITSRQCEPEKLRTVENYGKKGNLPPPAPADAPPTHPKYPVVFAQSSPNVLLFSG